MVILIESDVTDYSCLRRVTQVIIQCWFKQQMYSGQPETRQNAVKTSMATITRTSLRRNSSRCSPIVISTGKSIADGLIPQLTNIIVPRSITSVEPFISYAERAFNNLNYISLL
jgi:hypothetical protein